MIRHLQYDEINFDKWNDCIDRSFNSRIYAYSWFLDVVCDEWEALVEGDYESVMPLPLRKSWGINYLIQPVYTQQLGVFSAAQLDEDKISKFLNCLPKSIKFARIYLNTHNKLTEGKHRFLQRTNIELDLISDYPKIFSHYSTNCKRNVKKANKKSLEVTYHVTPERIVELFKEVKAKKLGDQLTMNYAIGLRLMHECMHRGIGHTVGVTNGYNEVIAGAFFIHHKDRIIFFFSGANMEARETSAMFKLIDFVIQENSGKSIVFDFEGSNDPHLAKFYLGFGGVKTIYCDLIMNRFPFPVKQIVEILKKLPGK